MEYDMEYEMDGECQWRYVPGPDECEDLEGYWTGGYHPVTIGDQLCEGKYTIVHKLGSGADATVWLAHAKNGDHSRYAALKILAADCSKEDDNELKIHRHLQQKNADGHNLTSVALLLDSFWLEGPNGKHLCLAFEVAGPSLTILRRHKRKFRPDMARALALQTARGLQELHDAGVVYGDLSTNNLLLKVVDIHSWTVEELYERLGHPEPWEIETPDGRPVSSHAPQTVYKSIQFCETSLEYLKAEIAFVDLADGRLVEESQQEKATGFSIAYAAPESLWFNEMQDKASDIWALACIFFEMRSGVQMFDDAYGDPEKAQMNIVKAIGDVPASWADKLASADDMLADEVPAEYVPANDTPEEVVREHVHEQPTEVVSIEKATTRSTRSMKWSLHKAWDWFMSLFTTREMPSEVESEAADEPYVIPEYFRRKKYVPQDESLHGKIERIGRWREWHYLSLETRVARMKEYSEEQYGHVTTADVDDEPPPGPLSDEEKGDLEDLLSLTLQYERTDRMALKDILDHPWLKKSYGEVVSEAWLKEYTMGWQATIMGHRKR